jgi:hypothetical protein
MTDIGTSIISRFDTQQPSHTKHGTTTPQNRHTAAANRLKLYLPLGHWKKAFISLSGGGLCGGHAAHGRRDAGSNDDFLGGRCTELVGDNHIVGTGLGRGVSAKVKRGCGLTGNGHAVLAPDEREGLGAAGGRGQLDGLVCADSNRDVGSRSGLSKGRDCEEKEAKEVFHGKLVGLQRLNLLNQRGDDLVGIVGRLGRGGHGCYSALNCSQTASAM